MATYETLEKIFGGELGTRNAVQLRSHLPDGRERVFGIDIFATDEGYAYGSAFVTEEADNGGFVMDLEASRQWIRIPVAAVIEPGEVTVGVAPETSLGPDFEGHESAAYEELTVAAESLKYITRDRN